MDWLVPILTKVDTTHLVLLIIIGGMGYLYLAERREGRADRQALMSLLERNTEAITQLRIAIAANSGKAV